VSRLYTDLAVAYHEMYGSLLDYQKEFDYYNGKPRDLGCARILEIGCGTGHLARSLIGGGYDYTGFDLSPDMIDIALSENPGGNFIIGDMKKMDLSLKFNAVLITGRTFIHLTEDEDVVRALESIHKHLSPGGYLMFDTIDSDFMKANFKSEIVHEADAGIRRYRRESRNTRMEGKEFRWRWDALYRIWEDGEERQVEDLMILRAFNRGELSGFLTSCGFNVIEIVREDIDLKTVALKSR